jgi:hypothetical protein
VSIAASVKARRVLGTRISLAMLARPFWCAFLMMGVSRPLSVATATLTSTELNLKWRTRPQLTLISLAVHACVGQMRTS